MPEPSSFPFDHVAAHEHLSRADKRLGQLINSVGAFHYKLDECDSVYESLLEAIVYQSISGKAAATILERVRALGTGGKCPVPEEMLRLRIQALRDAGLSNAKALAMKDLAQKTIEGIVPSLEAAEKMSDEELVERLVSVRGIGAWTVEMFLIFRLGRPDVLPIHDYGVQKGFALTYGKRHVPKPKYLLAYGERWRPYRTVASWYMWRAVEFAGKDARKVKKARPAASKTKPRAKDRPASTKRTAKKRAARKTKNRR